MPTLPGQRPTDVRDEREGGWERKHQVRQGLRWIRAGSRARISHQLHPSSPHSSWHRRQPQTGTGHCWLSHHTWRTCLGTGQLLEGGEVRVGTHYPMLMRMEEGSLHQPASGSGHHSVPDSSGRSCQATKWVVGAAGRGMEAFLPRRSSSWAQTVRTHISLLTTYTLRRLEMKQGYSQPHLHLQPLGSPGPGPPSVKLRLRTQHLSQFTLPPLPRSPHL